MELEQRIIIEYLTKQGLDANQILTKLQTRFGESAYALRTVRFWIAEFRRGPEDCHDDHRSESPRTVTPEFWPSSERPHLSPRARLHRG
jgi:hypothetical protein